MLTKTRGPASKVSFRRDRLVAVVTRIDVITRDFTSTTWPEQYPVADHVIHQRCNVRGFLGSAIAVKHTV